MLLHFCIEHCYEVGPSELVRTSRAARLMNPATYGCRKDEGEYAAERLLNGVRVGEENLLEHLGLA
jgi:hypothetical protein